MKTANFVLGYAKKNIIALAVTVVSMTLLVQTCIGSNHVTGDPGALFFPPWLGAGLNNLRKCLVNAELKTGILHGLFQAAANDQFLRINDATWCR